MRQLWCCNVCFYRFFWLCTLAYIPVVFCCMQSRTETDITKLKEKITKTKDQLAQLYPKYDTERRNEEHAASQCVASILLFFFYLFFRLLPSVCWCCWLCVKISIWPVKLSQRVAGAVISLEQYVNDLHMVHLMPLPAFLASWKSGIVFLSDASLLTLSWQRDH